MLNTVKKHLWSIICSVWALIIALFWFAMRVIWSGISKVIADAFGMDEPNALALNLPLYVSIFLFVLLALSVASLVFLNDKKYAYVKR